MISNEPLKNKLRQYLKAHDYVANSIELSNRINEQYGVPLEIQYNAFIRKLPDSPSYEDYRFSLEDKETIAKFNIFKRYGLTYYNQCHEFLKVNHELIQLLQLYLKESR